MSDGRGNLLISPGFNTYKRVREIVGEHHLIPVFKANMVSNQNTSEFLNDLTMANHIISACDQNVYFAQDPNNYETIQYVYLPENDVKQDVMTPTPSLTPTEPTTNLKDFYEVSEFSQHSSIQYTPLTPEPVSYPVFQPYQLQSRLNCNNFTSRKHCAQITILPTSRGNFKAVVKRKRKRTIFTTEQIEALEEIFKTKQYISREERQDIVNKLKLNDKAVKIWFQNRRLKIKRMAEEEAEDYGSRNPEGRISLIPDIARLDFVESQISQKTDKYGFVTLDDGIMRDLAYVIDDVLSKCLDFPVEEMKSDSPVYEPISPASTSDSNEEDPSYWEPSKPNESLQRLFDIQTMLTL